MSFDNQRLFDLVRQQRMELYQAELVDDDEYAELAKEHSAVRRLEDYDVIRAQLASLKAEHAQGRQPVKVHIGTSCLTKDLVWCECGRGLSLSGKWLYCPTCGHLIDQESYVSAVAEAKHNGASLYYRDSEMVEEIAEVRATLWLSHGHRGMYGDDGEMQCGECLPIGKLYDYKREPLHKLLVHVLMLRNVEIGRATGERNAFEQERDSQRLEITRLKDLLLICRTLIDEQRRADLMNSSSFKEYESHLAQIYAALEPPAKPIAGEPGT